MIFENNNFYEIVFLNLSIIKEGNSVHHIFLSFMTIWKINQKNFFLMFSHSIAWLFSYRKPKIIIKKLSLN